MDSRTVTQDAPRPDVPPAGDGLAFRSPHREDGADLWDLAVAVGLDENSPYAYLMWAEYFAASSIVAVDTTVGDGTGVVGFIIGFVPPGRDDVVFVWQIGVATTHRKRGIGDRMLEALVVNSGARYVEATVTPDNVASRTMFRRFGERHGGGTEVTPLFAAHHFPADAGDHEAEDRLLVGPLTVDPASSASSA